MECEKCNREHDGKYGSGRFCSSKCARSFSTCEKRKEINEKVSKKLIKTGKYCRNHVNECINCGEKVKISSQKYCSMKCQHEFQRKEKVKKWKEGFITGNIGKRGLSNSIRKYIFEKFNFKCSLCGWGEINDYTKKTPLTIHHKNGDCYDQSEENLDLLCPNCHSLTSTYGGANKGNGGYRYKYRYKSERI